MNTPNKEELNNQNHLGSLYIKKRYPEFYNFLENIYIDKTTSQKTSEKLYLYFHNMTEASKCPICGNYTKFLGFFKGYQTYCSLKCSNKSPEVIKKKESTCLKNHGVLHPCQNEIIKQKLIETSIQNNGGVGNASESIKFKQHKTMEDKYGVCYALQSQEFIDKSYKTRIKNYGSVKNSYLISHKKQKNTNLEKYGAYELLSTDIIRDKIRKTNLDKYGGHPIYDVNIKSKIINTKRNKRIQQRDDLLYIKNNGLWVVKCPHTDCNKCNEKCFEIEYQMLWDRTNDKTELCTHLLPPQISHSKNTTIELVIQNILDKYNIKYIQNDRSILNGKELDIYIPSHNLAIECNGCYWHASNVPNHYVSINKHSEKYNLCKSKNIQLLSLWQDWIINKYDIIESIILNKLGLTRRKIYARKCIISHITSKICNEFLERNHIQGATNSSIRYGLYYNNELISIMTFSKRKSDIWELNRFCSKLNTTVIGGASKLLNYFINQYNPSIIRSFSLNDISNGNLYIQLGFSQISNNKPYWYVSKDCTKRYHREYGRKDAILSRGEAPSLDKNEWTESKIMFKSGYLQIYSSGMIGWELKRTNLS